MIPLVTSTLLRASLEGAVFVLLVAAATRLVRMPATVRCALWWLATLRLLLGLAALPAIAVPMPHAPAALVRAVATPARTPAPDAPAPVVPRLADAAGSPTATAPGARPLPWGAIAFACWLAGALATVVVHVRDTARLARTWREAVPVAAPQAHAWLAGWLGDVRAARTELRVHDAVGAPMILAGRVPRILLPAACVDHDPARLRMALAHEAAHVRRHDLAWGVVPAIAHAAFWFHPLARWCIAEYAQAREEACDADALAMSRGEPERYGALLVEFGVDRSRAVHAAASCGSRHVRQLTRRIHMLAFVSRPSRTRRIATAALACAVALLAVVSVKFVGAGVADDDGPAVPPAPPAVAAPAAPAVPAVPPVPFAGRTSHTRSHGSSFGYSYTTGNEDQLSFGYTDGDGNTTMNGSWSDNDHWLRAIERRRGHGAFGWFRTDGSTYVVDDADDIDRMQEIMRPSAELGSQQGRLGDQQSGLGDRQSELGDKQRDLGDKMRELAERLGDVESRLADDRRGRDRDALEKQRDEIQAHMEECSRLMNELGEKQNALGEKQSALGRQQSELGRRQSELARTERREARELFEELQRRGRLTKIDD